MRPLLYPFRAMARFWTVPIRAEPLALFRILLGSVMLASLLTGLLWRLPAAFGEDPLLPNSIRFHWFDERPGHFSLLTGPVGFPLLGKWIPEKLGGKTALGQSLQGWLPEWQADAWRAWATRPSSAYLLFALYLLALAGMTAGFRTRLCTFFSFLLAATFNNSMVEYINGGDYLCRNGLWLLLFAPAGATWSVDAWQRRRRRQRRGLPEKPGPPLIEPWSVRLMQIQVCCMYLFAGLAKLADLHWEEGAWLPTGDWLDGTALYWVLNDVAITRWPYAQFPLPLILCKLLTWGTLAFEIGFAFLVPFRWLRGPVLIAGAMLHVGILAMMEIGWFSQITLCWYVLFLSGQRVAATVRWLAGPEEVPSQA